MKELLEKLRAQAQHGWEQVETFMTTRTLREQLFIGAALGLAVLFVCGQMYSSLSSGFAAQTEEFEKLTSDMRAASALLTDYGIKRAKVRQIEKRFEGQRGGEGILAYLENLVTTKAGVQRTSGFGNGFEIRERPPLQLAGVYQLSQYDLSMWTSDFPKFVDFLQAVEGGERPLIVSGLKIRKVGNRMQAEVQISRIQRQERGRRQKEEEEETAEEAA